MANAGGTVATVKRENHAWRTGSNPVLTTLTGGLTFTRMETTVLLNGKEVNKFGSGSMKGIDQTALKGIGLIAGPKGGGKSPVHGVLVKWGRLHVSIRQ